MAESPSSWHTLYNLNKFPRDSDWAVLLVFDEEFVNFTSEIKVALIWTSSVFGVVHFVELFIFYLQSECTVVLLMSFYLNRYKIHLVNKKLNILTLITTNLELWHTCNICISPKLHSLQACRGIVKSHRFYSFISLVFIFPILMDSTPHPPTHSASNLF